MPVTPHVHAIQHYPQGSKGWAVCECGATIRFENGTPVGQWHACATCVKDRA